MTWHSAKYLNRTDTSLRIRSGVHDVCLPAKYSLALTSRGSRFSIWGCDVTNNKSFVVPKYKRKKKSLFCLIFKKRSKIRFSVEFEGNLMATPLNVFVKFDWTLHAPPTVAKSIDPASLPKSSWRDNRVQPPTYDGPGHVGRFPGGLRYNKFFNNYELLLELREPFDEDSWDCPIELPDLEGLYAKVYLEDERHLRVFMRSKTAITSKGFTDIVFSGTVLWHHGWVGYFWQKVDSQVKAKRVWELGECKPRKFQNKKWAPY